MKIRVRSRLSLLLVTTAVFVFAVAACTNSGSTDYPIVPNDSLVSTGSTVYAANCATCHGDLDTPPPFPSAPPHTVDGHTWEHPDRPLVDMILNGATVVQTMPTFEGLLTEDEVRAAIAYIKTFWTADLLEQQMQISAEYEAGLEQ